MSTLAATIGRGLTASRPAAGEAGRLYYCTDSTIGWFRDNGSSWDSAEPSGLTDPTSNRGEIIRRGAAGLEALQAKTLGKILVGDGTDVVSDYPPGHEYNYTEITSSVLPAATAEGTATTIVTASAGVTLDGSTKVIVEFFSDFVKPDQGAAGRNIKIYLFDDTGGGAASIGRLAQLTTPAASDAGKPVLLRRILTPSNATHTWSIRAAVSAGTGFVDAGTGGSGNAMPAYIRITKA